QISAGVIDKRERTASVLFLGYPKLVRVVAIDMRKTGDVAHARDGAVAVPDQRNEVRSGHERAVPGQSVRAVDVAAAEEDVLIVRRHDDWRHDLIAAVV